MIDRRKFLGITAGAPRSQTGQRMSRRRRGTNFIDFQLGSSGEANRVILEPGGQKIPASRIR